MSALAVPLPPRLRLVSAEDGPASRLSVVPGVSGGAVAPAAERDDALADASRRPRLRLVTGGAASAVPSPLEPTRRPVTPRRARPLAVPVVSENPAEAARPGRKAAAPLPAVVRLLLIIGALVLAAVLVVAGGIVLSGFQSAPVETTIATVQSGQSLWDIAVATGAGDVNEVMAQIVDLNGLTSSTLQAGQTLVVPAG
ncbi:LysM domain-containing protein [Actinomyces ruminicola]|uniref:LysM domain-containing protein n=1 Tax=Actinomyces ruminicola TaxID=332524 RepID=A0A1H0BX67_9ACTO|nr:LysM peptidoglycan-binding domain-containing protein [Actinomyces ruminicola]SDN50234.1 LysM domain-containing protein [Actinomyces ruminicola]